MTHLLAVVAMLWEQDWALTLIVTSLDRVVLGLLGRYHPRGSLHCIISRGGLVVRFCLRLLLLRLLLPCMFSLESDEVFLWLGHILYLELNLSCLDLLGLNNLILPLRLQGSNLSLDL